MQLNNKHSTQQVLRSVDETLATAELGLSDFLAADRERRMSGLRNLIVFGRSVTFALQNLRSTEPGFDQWYAPHQERMRQSPVMRYFVDLRNEILKVGKLSLATTANLNFSTSDLSKLPKPRGATAFFIGDELGGSGWTIELADGSTEKFYVALPPSIGTVQQVFADIPEQKFPELLNRPVEELATEYIGWLRELVADARGHFLPVEQPAQIQRGHLRLVKG